MYTSNRSDQWELENKQFDDRNYQFTFGDTVAIDAPFALDLSHIIDKKNYAYMPHLLDENIPNNCSLSRINNSKSNSTLKKLVWNMRWNETDQKDNFISLDITSHCDMEIQSKCKADEKQLKCSNHEYGQQKVWYLFNALNILN